MGAARRRAALLEDRPQETASSPRRIPNQTKAYLVCMGEMPAQLTDEQLAELQRWADRLLARGEMVIWDRSPAIASLREEAERVRAGRSASGPRRRMPPLRRQAELPSRTALRTRCVPLRGRCSCSVTTLPCNGGMHARCTRDDADVRCSSSRAGLCARVSSWRSCPAVGQVRSTRQARRQRSSARPVSPRSRSPSGETRATSRPRAGGWTDGR